jgi:hypothetical protein
MWQAPAYYHIKCVYGANPCGHFNYARSASALPELRRGNRAENVGANWSVDHRLAATGPSTSFIIKKVLARGESDGDAHKFMTDSLVA